LSGAKRSRNPSEAKGKPPKRFGSRGKGHVTFNFLIKLIFSQREKIFLYFQLSTFNFPLNPPFGRILEDSFVNFLFCRKLLIKKVFPK